MRFGAFPDIRARCFDFAMDELRISDVVRYEPNKEFAPANRPFEADPNTLMLFHFDGDVSGSAGPAPRSVKAKFSSRGI